MRVWSLAWEFPRAKGIPSTPPPPKKSRVKTWTWAWEGSSPDFCHSSISRSYLQLASFFFWILNVSPPIQARNKVIHCSAKLHIELGMKTKGAALQNWIEDLVFHRPAEYPLGHRQRIPGKKKKKADKVKQSLSHYSASYLCICSLFSPSGIIRALLPHAMFRNSLAISYTFKLMSRQAAHGQSF